MKSQLRKNISNFWGWTTNQKIIVIESDDWGSIRMSSLTSFQKLRDRGLNLTGGDSGRYNSFDTLESSADLILLFETLRSFCDKDGTHPIFTSLSLVANPDFDKIRQNNFEAYVWEPFNQTLDKYKREGAFLLYEEGVTAKLFIPQFHGREHLNVAAWMRCLQQGDSQTLAAFNEGVWGFRNNNTNGINYQAAFDLEFHQDIELQKKIIIEGLQLFEELHKYKASFFVPPNGPINNTLEQTASENGIKYMSASKIQQEVLGGGKTRKVYHYLGQRNKWDQIYITRNCFFEPSMQGKDWVTSCLDDIKTAFRWRKPAVISTHRVNYIGSLNEANRKNGQKQLKLLLAAILQKWPEVIFLSSDQLGDLIQNSK